MSFWRLAKGGRAAGKEASGSGSGACESGRRSRSFQGAPARTVLRLRNCPRKSWREMRREEGRLPCHGGVPASLESPVREWGASHADGGRGDPVGNGLGRLEVFRKA